MVNNKEAENGEDDEPPRRLGSWLWQEMSDWIVFGPVIFALVYVVDLARDDLAMLNSTGFLWTCLFIGTAVVIVWRLGFRQPPADRWGAAAILVYGALPCAALVVPETPFYTLPGAYFTLPVVMAWNMTCQWAALRRGPALGTPGWRALVISVAALICGLVSLAGFAATVVGLAMSVWERPDGAWMTIALLIGVGLPWGIVWAYASVNMIREAGESLGRI